MQLLKALQMPQGDPAFAGHSGHLSPLLCPCGPWVWSDHAPISGLIHSLSAANCQEMVNLLCCVRTLTGHLKWKCQCRPEGTSAVGCGHTHTHVPLRHRGTAEGNTWVTWESQNIPKHRERDSKPPTPQISTDSVQSVTCQGKYLYTPQAHVGHTGAPQASFTTSLPPDCIDLVDEKGTLMNLSKVEDPASEYASKYLQGRQRYILVRVVRKFLVQMAQLSLWGRKGLLWGSFGEGSVQQSIEHSTDPRRQKPAWMKG